MKDSLKLSKELYNFAHTSNNLTIKIVSSLLKIAKFLNHLNFVKLPRIKDFAIVN